MYDVFSTLSHANNQCYLRKPDMCILCSCAFIKNSVLFSQQGSMFSSQILRFGKIKQGSDFMLYFTI